MNNDVYVFREKDKLNKGEIEDPVKMTAMEIKPHWREEDRVGVQHQL